MPHSDNHTELSSTISVLWPSCLGPGPAGRAGHVGPSALPPTTVGKPRVRTLFLVTAAKGRVGFSGLEDSELTPRNKKT